MKTVKKLSWILAFILIIIQCYFSFKNQYEYFGLKFSLLYLVGSISLNLIFILLFSKILSFFFKNKSFLSFFPIITIIVFAFFIEDSLEEKFIKETNQPLTRLPKYKTIQLPQDSICNLVKDGKFETENLIIERKGNQQTQEQKISGEIETYRVEWLSACEYKITNTKKPRNKIRVKISDVNPEEYSYYYKYGPYGYEGTLKIIK